MGARSLLRIVVLAVLFAWLAGAAPAGAVPRTPPGNPPGNNGTIKVARDAAPEPDNEPHIDGCRLWIEFFGFDEGERVRITFETHSPTGPGELLLTHEAVISDDPAGGGQDEDDVLGFNLSEALQNYEPHPQQGYHLKVSSDSLAAPGGSKQKVFWLQCTPAPAGIVRVQKAVEGAGTGPFVLVVRCNHAPAETEVTLGAGEARDIPVPYGTTCAVTEPDSKGAAEVRFTESTADGTNDGQVQVTSATPASVVVTNVFPAGATATAAGAQTAQVAGVTASAAPAATAAAPADTLPRTGSRSGVLAHVGAWVLAVGGLTLMVAHRR